MVWLSEHEDDGNVFTHITREDFKELDVLILVTDRKRWTRNQTHKLRRELNELFHKDDKVILEDHPDDNEKVGNIHMSNGRYTLLLVQKKSKLNKFATILKNTTDYYKNWNQKELDEVVTWRFEDPE